MSASQKLIINEDLTACLVLGGKKSYLPCTEHMHSIRRGSICYSAGNMRAPLYLSLVCFPVWGWAHREMISFQLSVYPTTVPSICFLKLFVNTCQVSCSNAAVSCVDSAQWRLPLCSTTSCSDVSSSAPCAFLIQHLWVVSWLASPETWTRVRLDLSWLGTLPPREFSVSEVTPLDKVYCRAFSLRAWLSVIPFTESSLQILVCGLLFKGMDDFVSVFSLETVVSVTLFLEKKLKATYVGTESLHMQMSRSGLHIMSDVFSVSSPQSMCVSPCKLKCCFRIWPWWCSAWGWWALSFLGSWSPSCLWGPSSLSSNESPGQSLTTGSYITARIEHITLHLPASILIRVIGNVIN